MKYTVNLDFWKDISKEESAYTLGFLCADGGIAFDGKTGNPGWWYVSSTDRVIVELMKKACGYTGPVQMSNDLRLGRSGVLHKPVFTLQVSRRAMVEDLLRLGLIHDKSTLGWVGSKVPRNRVRDFCRGAFDGDGSVFVTSRTRSQQLVVDYTDGSKVFVEGIAREWGKALQEKLMVHRGNGNCWEVRVTGPSASTILSWMYSGSKIFLERKMERAVIAVQHPWRSKSQAIAENNIRRKLKRMGKGIPETTLIKFGS